MTPAGQRGLFPPFGRTGAPHQPHSDTSRAAAEAIVGDLGKLQKVVIDYLRTRPDGATDDEMQLAIPMNPSTQRPRRVELATLEVIEKTGERRSTSSGGKAAVWRVK